MQFQFLDSSIHPRRNNSREAFLLQGLRRNLYDLKIESLILLPTWQAVQPSTPYLSAAIKFDASQAENLHLPHGFWFLGVSSKSGRGGRVAQFSAARGSLRIFGCRWDRTFLMVNPPVPIRLREKRYFGQIFWHQNTASWRGFYDDKSPCVYQILCVFFIGGRSSLNNSSVFRSSSATCIWHVYWANVSSELATIIAAPLPILP